MQSMDGSDTPHLPLTLRVGGAPSQALSLLSQVLTAAGLGGNPRSKFFLRPKAVPHILDATKNIRVSPSDMPEDFTNHCTA